MGLSARSQALAFRIWQVAQPAGWDMTIAEAADRLGAPLPSVRAVVVCKGWASRFRVSEHSRRIHARLDQTRRIGMDGLHVLEELVAC